MIPNKPANLRKARYSFEIKNLSTTNITKHDLYVEFGIALTDFRQEKKPVLSWEIKFGEIVFRTSHLKAKGTISPSLSYPSLFTLFRSDEFPVARFVLVRSGLGWSHSGRARVRSDGAEQGADQHRRRQCRDGRFGQWSCQQRVHYQETSMQD